VYRILLLAGIISSICVACASPSLQPDDGNLRPHLAAQKPKHTRSGLTEDVLYKLVVAEFARQRGDLTLSLEHYLELARTLADPQLAEWAIRLALFAKQDDQAEEAARLWMKRSQNDLEAQQILAVILLRQGRLQEALPHLESVLDAPGGNRGDKLRLIADLLSQERDKPAALSVMKQLVARRRQDPEALFAYGLLAFHAGRVDEAQRTMQKALQLAPTNINLVAGYVSLLHKEGRTQSALDWVEKRVSRQPKAFDLRMLYARFLAETKHFDEARKQFQILAKQAPKNADVHYGLGISYLQNNQLVKAKQHFTALLSEEQYLNQARYYLGQIAEASKDYESALKWYSAIDDDNYFDAQLNIALVLARQKKLEEARRHLHSLKAQVPQQELRIARIEGEILTEAGHYQEAMKIYDRVLGDRYDSELLYTRAMLAEKMGRLAILEQDLRRILEREPDNVQTLNALGYTLADRTDRHQEAYTLIKRALELSPNDFYILDSMGWVLYRLGRLQEAVRYLRKAQRIRNDPEVAAHLGEVLWVLGDKAEARKIWSKALKAKPDDKNLLKVIQRFKP
jgi:tetratricopeptide (TPR) repeat protein